MRSGCVALLMLIASVATFSAQEPFRFLTTRQEPLPANQEARLGPEAVVARLMSFDRNRDGKVAADELAERMEGLVARGDRNADGALDAAEVRTLSESPQVLTQNFRSLSGGYGFGDSVGQSSRTHIENSIDDLRLAPQTQAEAKRIGVAFAAELESTALANLRTALLPLLKPEQTTQFEADLNRLAGARTFRVTSNGTHQVISIGMDPTFLLRRHQLSAEQMKTATAAIETFKADQQLDDARRSALVAQLSGLLTAEERENVSAALARRPLVKGLGGGVGDVQVVMRQALTQLEASQPVVRDLVFTPAVPAR